MSTPSLAAAERKFLAGLPHHSTDATRLTEFEQAFGDSVVEAAAAVASTIGIIGQEQVVELAEHFAGVLTEGLDTAAAQVGATGHPWILQGQRWAVEAFFAQIGALRNAMVEGGRA